MNPHDPSFIAIVAAILISGTTHTPEEGIAKAQHLIALAASTDTTTEEES